MRKWCIRTTKIAFCIVLTCFIFAGFLYFNNDIGISKSRIESDIRSSQKVQDDWFVEGTTSDAMAAYISYPQDRSDHSFSVYVNRPGLSFGYFFRGGGDILSVEKYITEFTVDGYLERAFISMNNQHAARLEIHDGNTAEVVDIDSEKPFAILLPVNAGSIFFYDVDGNIVETVKNPL